MENRITLRRIDVPEVPIVWTQKPEVTTYSIARQSSAIVRFVKANPEKAESTAKTCVAVGATMIALGLIIWGLAKYYK